VGGKPELVAVLLHCVHVWWNCDVFSKFLFNVILIAALRYVLGRCNNIYTEILATFFHHVCLTASDDVESDVFKLLCPSCNREVTPIE
jgi:hypothetical protein